MTGILDPLTLTGEGDLFAAEPVDVDDAPAVPADVPGSPELEQVRQLVLRAHPDVVPELVTGATIGDLLASVEPAAAAYAALASRITAATPPQVPAGSTEPVPVDLDRLPIAEKLRRGLAERSRHATR